MNPMIRIGSCARAIDLTAMRSRWVGVYFLICAGEIIYVGQSTDVDTRIAGHIKNERKNKKTFDSAFWIELAEDDLGAYEGAFIRALNPPCNWSAPTDVGRDREVLALFSLEPDPEAFRQFQIRRKTRFSGPRDKRSSKHRTLQRRNVQQGRVKRLFAGLEALFATRSAAA